MVGLLILPARAGSLSNEPITSKKSARGNVAAVTLAAIALERGEKVDPGALDEVIYNGDATIHPNGVVELAFPHNGLRSYSVAGKIPRIRMKQVGGFLMSEPFVDTVDGETITHVQSFPVASQARAVLENVRKVFPRRKNWVIRPDILMSPFDYWLVDMIGSCRKYKLDFVLEKYPKKVSMDKATGAVYLDLDNPVKGIHTLRFKGVTPARDWLLRPIKKAVAGWSVRIVNGIPTIVRTRTLSPAGTMDLGDAQNEFIMASNFYGDEPLGVGKTSPFMWGRRTGFVVYGLRDDDTRSGINGRRTILRDGLYDREDPIGDDGFAFFRGLGRFLGGAHSMNLIHGALSLDRVGVSDWLRMNPILKDFHRARHLPVNVSPHVKAEWMFVDVAGIISEWSRMEGPRWDADNFTNDFLTGYFDSYVPRAVRVECLSPIFARKLDRVQPGKTLDIKAEFPALYKFFLAKAVADDINFTKDDRDPMSDFRSDYDATIEEGAILVSPGWDDDFDSIISVVRRVKSAI